MYFHRIPNFGDLLNPWLFPQIFPNIFDGDPSKLFFGIGTILYPGHPKKHDKHVFGSGYGSNKVSVTAFKENWIFHFVRGPKTAKTLGLDPSLAIADPAILVHSFHKPVEKKFKISFMPHWSHEARYDFQPICQDLGIRYISPSITDVEKVMDDISASEIVIAEAMHGAIVADALRIPWIPLSLEGVNTFKWSDWCESMELKYEPAILSSALSNQKILVKILKRMNHFKALKDLYVRTALTKIINNLQPILSNDSVFDERLTRIWDKVEFFHKNLKVMV
ncbi:polysaccharide pyruvyl transferase family protein [Symplocastrum sp. BBK-W-15]|uniref:Polysaccharide pyruvyl transferase family protein n=2 Tax=Limnofasciculus TaxID=3064905 RepID=A0AAE3GW90_9CYAN|nr:polysaccharide pyruvyl transferase family protein [Limnofasciculus baicalensis BBK-W-15]